MTLLPSEVRMRPFGRAIDLNVDFGQADRPGLVTALLAQCGEQTDAEFWWDQPVGRRAAALLRLFALTEQRDEIALSARCAVAACGELFEFELPLRSLYGTAADDAPLHVRLDDTRAVTIRRPTGADLRRWREAQPASRTDAVRLMLDSLVVAGQVGVEDESSIATSIAAADPLVDFTVSCRCPACRAANEVAVDLEALALASLARRQRALMRDVHLFASHYGWTETEVLALPAARRACYAALIEGQS